MKALILVGGFGTRLRPLTFTKPKPLVEFCNKPIVMHQIEALAAVGVDEVVLAVGFKPDAMVAVLKEIEETCKVKVTLSEETVPMGTGGPLALARAHLVAEAEPDAPFFVFNSDVTCDYPLEAMLAFHRAHGKQGTICVTKVKDPSKYGVVVHDEAGKIDRFVEKPKEFVGDEINAGLYLFSPSMLARIPERPTSIEKEVFPAMAADGELYSMTLEGYWMDIGQPKDYLTGVGMHLASLRERAPAALADGEADPRIVGNVMVHPSATLGEGCRVGPDVVVGPDCVVGAGARVSGATLLGGASVAAHGVVKDSIIGWGSSVGEWARVAGKSVIGEDVAVAAEVALEGTIVLPHKGIKADCFEVGKIIINPDDPGASRKPSDAGAVDPLEVAERGDPFGLGRFRGGARRQFMFGMHPHGPIPLGASLFFPQLSRFPWLVRRLRVGVASAVFWAPLLRDFYLGFGCVDAGEPTVRRTLEAGFDMLLLPGGIREQLLVCKPEEETIVLRRRPGFIRLALEYGCDLVPVLVFGERRGYKMSRVLAPLSSALRALTGMGVPLLRGQYFTLVPFPHPVTILIGKPLRTGPALARRPTDAEVEAVRDRYEGALQSLWREHREEAGCGGVDLVVVTPEDKRRKSKEGKGGDVGEESK